MHQNTWQYIESLWNQYNTDLFSRSCWERPQTRSLFPWAPCWSCENPSPVQTGREDLAACRGEAEASSHLLAFNFGSGAAASQGVTNPTATCSYSFILFPPHPWRKIWQQGRNSVLALSHAALWPNSTGWGSIARQALPVSRPQASIHLFVDCGVGCPSRNRT